MDPDEVLRLFRVAITEVVDIGANKRIGSGMELQSMILNLVEAADKIGDHGRDLLSWIDSGGFLPSSDG